MGLTWHCHYCPAVFPQFKALTEHYEANHAQHLKRYSVTNKLGKGRGIVQTTSEDEACRFFGWTPDECKVTILPK